MAKLGWIGMAWAGLLVVAGTAPAQVYWKGGNPIPKKEDIYGTPLTPEADKWLTAANENYNERWKKFRDGPMRNMASYRADFENDRFYMNTKDGKTLEYRLQMVGTEGLKDRSWEWAWNNPTVNKDSAAASRRLIPIGNKFNLRYVTHGRIPLAKDHMGFYLSGLALHANPDALTAFRIPDNEGNLAIYTLLYGPPKEVDAKFGRLGGNTETSASERK